MSLFKTNKSTKTPRTPFDLSHERKTTFNIGDLAPVLVQEVVPGDEMKIQSQVHTKTAPLIAPMMHRVDQYIHYFYVPNRILWQYWDDFLTGELEAVLPEHLSSIDIPIGGLFDHLGLPTGVKLAEISGVHELPARAYYKIFNDYYRDQNYQDEIDIETLGDYARGDAQLLKRNYERDYFTSALPWTQKGDPVGVPTTPNYIQTGSLAVNASSAALITGDLRADSGSINDGTNSVIIKNLVDGAEDSILINDLRKANALQRWLEKNARGGTRMVEFLKNHFGLSPQDARLNRAEYLGGGKSTLQISEILNTSDTTNAPQGAMAGHGLGIGQTNSAKKFVPEYGYIMGIMSIMPKPAYMQGVPKHFLRNDNMDFYNPAFAHLGEQEILNKELFITTDLGAPEGINEDTWGYQSRYAELKYSANTVHGDFRDTLDFWHMTRKFATLPTLSEEFMQVDDADHERVFAVNDDGETTKFWVQLYHDIKAIRPMPYYGEPKL